MSPKHLFIFPWKGKTVTWWSSQSPVTIDQDPPNDCEGCVGRLLRRLTGLTWNSSPHAFQGTCWPRFQGVCFSLELLAASIPSSPWVHVVPLPQHRPRQPQAGPSFAIFFIRLQIPHVTRYWGRYQDWDLDRDRTEVKWLASLLSQEYLSGCLWILSQRILEKTPSS